MQRIGNRDTESSGAPGVPGWPEVGSGGVGGAGAQFCTGAGWGCSLLEVCTRLKLHPLFSLAAQIFLHLFEVFSNIAHLLLG